MIQLSAPYSIGKAVYFLLGGQITEGITTACTVKFDGQCHSVVYDVAYYDAIEGPIKATLRQNQLFESRTFLVESLMADSAKLTPDEIDAILEHYHITDSYCKVVDAETEPEATLGSVMAEVAQQWRKQLDEQPNPETVER